MVVHINNNIAKAVCDYINDQIDAGAGPGLLRVYSGTRPASADTALAGTETLLIEFELADPAFAASTTVGNTGTAVANAVTPVQALATGTASFFQILDSDETVIFDGSVTDINGVGDLKLSTTAVVSGIDVTVVSLTAVMPEGV